MQKKKEKEKEKKKERRDGVGGEKKFSSETCLLFWSQRVTVSLLFLFWKM